MTSDFWASLREARIKAANHLWDFWVEAVYSFKKNEASKLNCTFVRHFVEDSKA